MKRKESERYPCFDENNNDALGVYVGFKSGEIINDILGGDEEGRESVEDLSYIGVNIYVK